MIGYARFDGNVNGYARLDDISQPNWDIYKYHVVVSMTDNECVSKTNNLGTFSSAKLCADVALPDPICIGDEIMRIQIGDAVVVQ